MKTGTGKIYGCTRQDQLKKMSRIFQKAYPTYPTTSIKTTPNGGGSYYHKHTIQSLVPLFILLFHLLELYILFSHVIFQHSSQAPISSKTFLISFTLAHFPQYVTLLLYFLYFTFYPVIQKYSLSTLFQSVLKVKDCTIHEHCQVINTISYVQQELNCQNHGFLKGG